MKKYVIISGGFDPIHEGHINLIQESSKISDGVIVLLNSKEWLCRKKGCNFLETRTRKIICQNIKAVQAVFEFDDTDNSASKGLELVRKEYPSDKLYFANGGDRNSKNILETEACNNLNIELIFGIGGYYKANSSSIILEKYIKSTSL